MFRSESVQFIEDFGVDGSANFWLYEMDKFTHTKFCDDHDEKCNSNPSILTINV